MSTELLVLPWLLLGVVVLAVVVGWLASLGPELDVGKRWAWKNARYLIRTEWESLGGFSVKAYLENQEVDDWGIDYLRIAIYCLGEKEITKRIKRINL